MMGNEFNQPSAHERRRIESFAKGKIVFAFPALYQGWECDPYGYIVRGASDGLMKLVLTSHGSPYFGKASEADALINSYESAISLTRRALSILNQGVV